MLYGGSMGGATLPHNRFDVHTVSAGHAATAERFRRIVEILHRLPECHR